MPSPKRAASKWETSSRSASSRPHSAKHKKGKHAKHKNKENIAEDEDLAEQLQKVRHLLDICIGSSYGLMYLTLRPPI